MSKLLADLNPEQQRAVITTNGPLLILAGAGSGKTRALTHRIAYLLEQGLAEPHNILALTFTNKAAAEMRHRVNQLYDFSKYTPPTIGTFHSLGVRLLRQWGSRLQRSANFSIFDTADSERLIRHIVREFGLPPNQVKASQLRAQISRAKNQLLTPADVGRGAQRESEMLLSRVYERYEQMLVEQTAYDFDDLIVRPLELLQQHQDIRAACQARWTYLSVDEYQDTNPAQDRLLQLLLGPARNICVVGDDYQSIYSWRGSRVDHILNFEKRFPGCQVIYLTQNYRSTPQILASAGDIIKENITQKHKDLWTKLPAGEEVQVRQLPSDRHEAAWVRQQLNEYRAAGGRLTDCAVLYRTNVQSRLLEEEFVRHSIPYIIVGGLKFYERREVKEALAFLQWWVNPNFQPALTRLSQCLWPGIGPKTLVAWQAQAHTEQRDVLDVMLAQVKKRPALAQSLAAFQTSKQKKHITVADLLYELLEHSGYAKALRQTADGEGRWENIEELGNMAANYQDPALFIQEIALLTDIDAAKEGRDHVWCLTLHAAKGLEFPVVFIIGCEEGLLPHINSWGVTGQLDEERRLMYVGMTRARHRLILTHAQIRYHRGERHSQIPSRFLRSLNEPQSTTSEPELIAYAFPAAF